MDKELLKKAFEAGRDYQYNIDPYSGKPNNDKALSFTKWYNKLVKKLTLTDVSQQRELLLAYERSQYETTWWMSEEECTNRINDFLANNCS
jgi:hypothetical protein